MYLFYFKVHTIKKQNTKDMHSTKTEIHNEQHIGIER